jgi:hypothetical protein
MARFFPLLFLLMGCSARKDFNTVNIHLNPKSYGWHFIELTKVGPKENYKTANVKFDSGVYLQAAVVSDFDAVDYNVYDADSNEISSTMKLPSVFYHTNQKTYFTFYNPTPSDLEEVKQWLPDNAEYDRIMRLRKEAESKRIK